MKAKKIFATLMAATMAATVLAGCGGSSGSSAGSSASAPASQETASGEADTSIDMEGEPYTVNFCYLVAQEGADQQKVNEAVNELTMRELNMKVNMIPMTFGTYSNQIQLMLSSGEDLDIFPAFAANMADYITSQYIVDLNDYEPYLTGVMDVMGEEDYYAGTVAGFLTGFPRMQERGYPAGLVVRKDIFDELGYKIEDFAGIRPDNWDDYQKITDLFAAVHEAYPDMVVLDGTVSLGTSTYAWTDVLSDTFGVLENYGQTTTVTNWFETDQFYQLAKLHRTWFENGYESADIATNTDSGEIKMKAGNCFSFLLYYKPNTAAEKLSQTGYEVEVIELSDACKMTTGVASAVFSIANASKDKVKAAQFLNWAYTNGEFNDLINWGVEGLDWVEDENGNACYPEGVTAATCGYHNDYGWIYPNQFAGHAWVGNDADIWDQYKVYNDSMMTSKAYGFQLDTTPVATEIAQLNTVWSQYQKDVCFGILDPDTAIKEMNDAMYAAGLQTVIDEKQKQLDEWLAAQN